MHSFFFDDTNWAIRYLVVDTGRWLPGRKVLIAPTALGRPDWQGRVFPLNLTKDQVRSSPDIDTDRPVSRQREAELRKYYDWAPYWGVGYGLDLPPGQYVEADRGAVAVENGRGIPTCEAPRRSGATGSTPRMARSAMLRILSSATTSG